MDTAINSSQTFDPNAYKGCPNISQGFGRSFSSLLPDSERNKRILDVGCGNQAGFLMQGPNIYGVDPNLGVFRKDGKVVGNVTPYAPGKAMRALAEQLPFKDEAFDYAISEKAVGFYPRQINLEMALREMLRVVKKRTGAVYFNVGQEMTDEILNPVLEKLTGEGYIVWPRDGNQVYLTHGEYERR